MKEKFNKEIGNEVEKKTREDFEKALAIFLKNPYCRIEISRAEKTVSTIINPRIKI